MKQFNIQKSCSSGDDITLEGEDFHYLCHVRRMQQGNELLILNSEAEQYKAILSEISEDYCLLSIGEKVESSQRDYEIDLYCCLPKGKKLDLIIRQATEVGVNKIHLLYSDHSLVKYGNEQDLKKKIMRWEKIISEAKQQSGSVIQTEIVSPINLRSLETIDIEREAVFYCHQEKLKAADLKKRLSTPLKRIAVLIGPEGGLSDREIEYLDEKQYNTLHFGANVLRAETACLYALATLISHKEFS